MGLNKLGFRTKLHFDIPDYEFSKEKVAPLNTTSIDEWKHFRQMANEACGLLLGHVQAPGEIRIWPHHFDTGIYVMIKDHLGLGFGLAMQDDLAGAPYFYMAAYPKTGNLQYNNLPESDEWEWKIGEHWQGAILSIDQFRNKAEAMQKATLNNYLTTVFKWYIAQ